MAHTLNALKRQRQNRKRSALNHAVKTEVKTQIKKVLEAIRGNDAGRAREEFKKATSLLDRAASKGVLHRNNARRRKARLASKVEALGGGKG